ncbi:MAG: ATP-binding protein [Acidobacteriota bacterium]
MADAAGGPLSGRSRDPSQLEQVVMNLVVNARDAMPDGGEIRIRTRNEVRNDERQVVLTVEDTGEGMTPEVRERIFEPFFTTRRAGGSSGLGLATVHGIMRQYQGLIEVDSEPGRGTVFEVVLPASRGPVIGKGARSDPRIPAPRRPAGVLLVEDNERMRAATAELLETLGHAVVVARDGAEALRILSEDPAGPDLLVCDVVMPEMSGPALLDQLRGRGYRLPCLFITGHADSTMFQHGLEPDLAVLAKPFTARDLADKINGILESPRSRPAPS